MDGLVDYYDQQDAIIVSVVSLYDTYLGERPVFTRLTFPLLFSSLGTTAVSRIFTNDGHGGAVHQQYIGFYTCLLCSDDLKPGSVGPEL